MQPVSPFAAPPNVRKGVICDILIALRLNQRPRKTLDFQTPADRLQAVLH